MSDKQLHEMTDEELMNVDLTALVEDNQSVETNEEHSQSSQSDKVELPEPVENNEVANVPDENVENTEPQEQADVEIADTVDYQSFYNELTKPFRANGREISVKDPKDIITLMQQGANYSKKMEELKPKKAVLKTLEQHGLLDNDELAYLIDLRNKDPKAIAKLVKESGIDLYAFDTEQANEYQPQQIIQSESPLEEVLNELYADEGFRNVLSNITDTWDVKSRDVISNNPQLLRIIHEHHQSGIYDKVMGYVEYEKMLGRINKPIIEAYIDAERALNVAQENSQAFTAPRPIVENKQEPVDTNKKKASLPTGGVNSGTVTVDIAKLSDAELVKYLQENNLL